MKQLQHIQENIENLTSLWETATRPFDAFHKTTHYNYGILEGTDWPNRLWFPKGIEQMRIANAHDFLKQQALQLILCHWSNDKTSHQLFVDHGFDLLFEQIGMYLKPSYSYDVNKEIRIQRVKSAEEVKQWATYYPQAFGYRISAFTLNSTLKDIHFYLALDGQQPIGTVMLYKTDKVLGIHGLGILPEMRRKGYADQIMKLIINKALEERIAGIALQASDMSKNIYLNLGFEAQFHIYNYSLKK